MYFFLFSFTLNKTIKITFSTEHYCSLHMSNTGLFKQNVSIP